MTAAEAHRISEANAYTIDKFKEDIKNHLKDEYNKGSCHFVTPIGLMVSDTFVSEVVELGYNIRRHVDPIGVASYVITW